MSPAARFAAATAEITGWWRVVEMCLPAHEAGHAATFRPRGAETLDSDWDAWTATIFVPVLRPSLVSLQRAVAAQNLEALLAADAELGAALPETASRGSLLVGRRALLDFVPPRGAKLLERLRQNAEANDSAGHMATVFAVRTNVFHIPSVQASGALLLAECILGAGVTLAAERVAGMLGRTAQIPANVPDLGLLAV